MTSLEMERKLNSQGFGLVGGVDEVGRGCLAGPVAAGFVIFPADVDDDILHQITDSKKLTAIKRQDLLKIIQEHALSAQVGWASVDEIDSIGIAPATKLAMKRAIEKSLIRPDYLLVDAINLDDLPFPQRAVIKGDQISRTIAAASIVAKVVRDQYMSDIAPKYLGYDFEKNKGYGTKDHMIAIKSLGPTDVHRISFEPVASMNS
ncbi:MAG TPA: ribonuclease HII [Dehalococcoidia bacterium]|nr:ribonuclease HII [Dehalococcoidia bacterium]|tara:strand:- start:549 stop:1163 length:615 start_codon:yes stop_codon:yes gene_type:complete